LGGSGLCVCNLLFDTNNFGLGAILLSCLVFELQETPSAGIELRTLFPEFWPSYDLFLVSRNKHAKFGSNQFIRSRAINEETHKPTISTLYVRLFRRASALKG
jgi:hypothetical protein